jgi:FtsP/CotA-like multicopper oxidase with cupredoxin domain
MRTTIAVVLATGLLGASPQEHRAIVSDARALEHITPNDNRTPAGTVRNGVLTIRLEIRQGEWHPDGDTDPSLVVRAFAEEGKPASVPGPLIRVPEGTEIHAFVRNTLRDSAVVVHGLGARAGAATASSDSMRVEPGAVREVRFATGPAGTYYYWAATSGDFLTRRYNDAELSGAFIVDPRGTVGPPTDRVFVINLWSKELRPGGVLATGDLVRFTINGKSWPNTERLVYSAGDTVRFRLVNASFAPHPMHLHGFYFKVESRGDGTRDSTYDPHSAPYLVVTERLRPGTTFTMSWVPDRPGNWLFHCHDNAHALRNRPLDGTPLPPEQDMHVHNHALEMMGGLVMGIEVRENGVVKSAGEPPVQRRLRLVARAEGGGTLAEPSFGYVLYDGWSKIKPSQESLLPAPTIVLKRGERVSITVVNELPEPTSVHWHGIELDSYFDGVADYSGHPGRIPPAIAPRDSFEARFTPPRSGTFIYHPHADELRQQTAGMAGALVVLDDPATWNPDKDIVLLLTIPRRREDAGTILLNGTNAPAARELRVGERYRLRVVDIHPTRPAMIGRLMHDSALVTWRAIAKDGMDLPAERATVRPAMQQMGNGETYDYELIPSAPGDLRFTVTSAVGALLVSMPIHVRP